MKCFLKFLTFPVYIEYQSLILEDDSHVFAMDLENVKAFIKQPQKVLFNLIAFTSVLLPWFFALWRKNSEQIWLQICRVIFCGKKTIYMKQIALCILKMLMVHFNQTVSSVKFGMIFWPFNTFWPSRSNLVPRVSHLPAPWSRRRETLV